MMMNGREYSRKYIRDEDMKIMFYMLYKTKEAHIAPNDYQTLKTLLPNWFMTDYFMGDYQNFLSEEVTSFSIETIKSIILANEDDVLKTPDSVSELIKSLYPESITDQRVLDLCSGRGQFLNKIQSLHPKSSLGIEMNEKSVLLARIEEALLDEDIDYRASDVFDPKILTEHDTFDFIFSNFPWGTARFNKITPTSLIYPNVTHADIPFELIQTEDYYFVSLVLRHLSEQGKAVVVMTSGALSNTVDERVRQYLIEASLIESVIALPKRVFESTLNPVFLVVLSKTPKEGVLMLDLEDFKEEGRRRIQAVDVNRVMETLRETPEVIQTMVPASLIKEHQYYLNPRYYKELMMLGDIEGEALDTLCDVFTGWQVSSKTMEEMFMPEKEGNAHAIIQMSDIQEEGEVTLNYEYVIPSKPRMVYQVKKGDVLLTTKTHQVKVGFIKETPQYYAIASGNIIVLRPHPEKILSEYLYLYLTSETGKRFLKLQQTGNIIPNLTINNVKSIVIPTLPIETQQSIANQYLELENKKRELRTSLEAINQSIKALL